MQRAEKQKIMNLKDYKSGKYKQQYQYQSFTPTLVNHSWVWDDAKINTLLEEATRSLGELNAFSLIVPNIDLFIRMHIIKEAQTSSRIEGTATTVDEAIIEQAEDIDPERRDDWEEVQNYIKAMNIAIDELQTLPLSNRLLKQTHRTLLQGVRGTQKTPGEWRESQNWIGGTSLTDAVFIPPHHNEVSDLMSDLERFWHNEQINVPHLVRIAISHYQFETIHPFLDGNGRIGRLLITLYFVSHGLLHKPSLYLSDYFERNRSAYYEALTHVRQSSDLGHWIKFFLVAIIKTAEKGKETFQQILQLRNEMDMKLHEMGKRSKSGKELVELLYVRPIVNRTIIADRLNIGVRTADYLIIEFVEKGILVEKTGYKRNRQFLFESYFSLFLKQ